MNGEAVTESLRDVEVADDVAEAAKLADAEVARGHVRVDTQDGAFKQCLLNSTPLAVDEVLPTQGIFPSVRARVRHTIAVLLLLQKPRRFP